MRKPDFCICGIKGADQLCGNSAADQLLCFCYILVDSTILLLLWLYSLVCVGPGLKPEDRFWRNATHMSL